MILTTSQSINNSNAKQ